MDELTYRSNARAALVCALLGAALVAAGPVWWFGVGKGIGPWVAALPLTGLGLLLAAYLGAGWTSADAGALRLHGPFRVRVIHWDGIADVRLVRIDSLKGSPPDRAAVVLSGGKVVQLPALPGPWGAGLGEQVQEVRDPWRRQNAAARSAPAEAPEVRRFFGSGTTRLYLAQSLGCAVFLGLFGRLASVQDDRRWRPGGRWPSR
ncbi:hypothetical protein ACIRBX_22080 [Kitasatospora sp. NPDC096147]|uniref:hypothetical protein n=1 Tax=Kitasatospora sp. NPDC096147 TaxID=3364093 RepID=UPI003802F4CE